MITKTVVVGDKEITFKMSAATPRIYRAKFKEDLILAMEHPENLEIFENLAWITAGCPDKSVEKWLEKLPPTFAVEVTGLMLELWGENVETVEGAETANEGDSKNAEKEES